MTVARTALVALAAVALLPGGASAARPLDAVAAADLAFARAQLTRTLGEVPGTAYPHMTDAAGRWTTSGPSAWTSGFFAGSLWLAYDETRDPAWREAAAARQAGLEPQKTNISTHDLGFMLLDSFGNGHRLTGDPHAREVLLTAAGSLATRYDPDVRMTRSLNNASTADPSDFKVLVDNLMNLQLLFWAARHGGDPDLATYARSHALRSAVEHVRADGSTHHLVVFHSGTGAVKRKVTVQGYADGSTWSRGQAWAVNGFTGAWRETRDVRLLDAARRTADHFLSRLPADRVPPWDFDAPGPGQPRDSSAAAIAADGLLELSRIDPDAARRTRYFAAAEAILLSLSTPAYLAEGTPSRSILLHGTADRPKGLYDRGLVYGDYFFMRALLRYRAIRKAQEPPPGGGDPGDGTPGSDTPGDGEPRPRPRLTLRLVRGAKPPRLRRALRRGVVVRVRASARGRLTGALVRRAGTSRSTRVARGKRRLGRAGSARLRLRFTRRWRVRLGSARRVRLRVRVALVDRSGRRAHASARVVLRR